MAQSQLTTQRVVVDASCVRTCEALRQCGTLRQIVDLDHDSVTPVVFATRANPGVQRELLCTFRDFMTSREPCFACDDVHHMNTLFWYSLAKCALNSARHFLYACLQGGGLYGVSISETIMDRMCAVVHLHNGMFDLISKTRHDIYTNVLQSLTYAPKCFTADTHCHVRWFRRHGVVYLHAFADLAQNTRCEDMKLQARRFVHAGLYALNAYVDFLQNISESDAACFFSPVDKSLACTKRGYPNFYYCVSDADCDVLFMTIHAMATIMRTYKHARYDVYVCTGRVVCLGVLGPASISKGAVDNG